MSKNLMNILGLSATVVGIGATLVSNIVNEKKMEEKIEEKVNEALAKQEKEEES